MKKLIDMHIRIEPEFHACLKEIARQQDTTMTNVICSYILDTVMKDKNGKITDGECWINEYNRKQKVGKLWTADTSSWDNVKEDPFVGGGW